jgi:hypothetical protein
MKKITSLILTAAAVLSLSSCLKENGYLDVKNDEGSSLMYIPYSGSKGYFPQSALLVAGTTVSDTFHYKIPIYYAGGKMASSDITYKLKVDDTKRTAYNSANPNSYFALPADHYKFTTTTGTLKAGTNRDSLDIEFYPWKFDVTKNYMLPITLYDASGTTISPELSTFYYHAIGNPIAGVYTWDFYRWNNNDGSGPTAGGTFTGDHTLFLPTDPTTIEVESGYFIQPRYVITFVNNGTSLTNFAVVTKPEDVSALLAQGVSITVQPNFITANPVTKRFTVQYSVFNGSAFRYLIDDFYP